MNKRFSTLGVLKDKNHPLHHKKRMERDLAAVQQKDVEAESMDEFTNDEGSIDTGETRYYHSNGVVAYIASGNDIYDEFSIHANWALFDADGNPMIWGDSETGIVNLTQVQFNGTTLLESLVQLLQEGWVIYQRATVGSEVRVLRLGMMTNGTYPEGRMEFFEPGAAVTIPNGDFASGDMTGWIEPLLGTQLDCPNSSYAAQCMVFDADGNLYVGFDAGGLYKLSGGTWTNLALSDFTSVRALAVDAAGNLYIGGEVAGAATSCVYMYDGSSFTAVGALDIFKKCYALAVDGSGNVYAGGDFATSSVWMWDGANWAAVGTLKPGVGGYNTQALVLDGSGNLIAGGSNLPTSNVNSWDGATWTALGTLSSTVVKLAIDTSDNLYAATSTPSITQWTGATWSSVGTTTPGTTLAMAFDADDNLITASATGIYLYNGNWHEVCDFNEDARCIAIRSGVIYVGGDAFTDSNVWRFEKRFSAANNYAEAGFLASEAAWVSSEDRFAVTAGQAYNFSMDGGGTATGGALDIILQVVFYSAITGGSVIATETVGERSQNELIPPITLQRSITVPAGATHAEFFATATADVDFDVWVDNFEVMAITLTALVFEDGDLSYEKADGQQTSIVPKSRVIYAKSEKVAIGTSPTRVFECALPAPFFQSGKKALHFRFFAYTDTPGTSRTITATLNVGGTAITDTAAFGANRTDKHQIAGSVFRSTTDEQVGEFMGTSIGTALITADPFIGYGKVSNDDAAEITVSFDISSNSALDEGFFGGVVVTEVDDCDVY